MRSLLFLASGALILAFATSGCEIQPSLGRCESLLDCDRSGLNQARCVQYANPAAECSSSGTINDCICCPTTFPAGIDPMISMLCMRGTELTDAPIVTDAVASDVSTDAPHACNPACTTGITYCASGTCLPLRSLGTTCESDDECMGSHCTAEHVCCQIACAASGYSCAVPGLEGMCVALPMDAGVDTMMSKPDVAVDASTDASMDAAVAE